WDIQLLEHFSRFELYPANGRVSLQARAFIEEPVQIEQSLREGVRIVGIGVDDVVLVDGHCCPGTRQCGRHQGDCERERRKTRLCLAHQRIVMPPAGEPGNAINTSWVRRSAPQTD